MNFHPLPGLFSGPLFLALALAAFADDPELTNYKTGIDVVFGGTKGTDYMEEYYYYDKLISDHKVVYIRSDNSILARHNSRNIAGAASDKYIAVGTDVGAIRYRLDRDLQWGLFWVGSGAGVNPLFPASLRFQDLTYEAGVPVVGTTGPKEGFSLTNTDKTNYYARGCLDAFGDEHHVMAVADDDSAFTANSEYQASDGKLINFVVNPKTPCLTVRAVGTGQFYTTPLRVYNLPVIRQQTTYIQGGVSFELKDLFGQSVTYRVNQGAWDTAPNPTLDQSAFATGSNTLEYYCTGDPAHTKTRTVVKNPPFPSAGEPHGNLLWKDDAGYAVVQGRLTRSPYAWLLGQYQTNTYYHGQVVWDTTVHRGLRCSAPAVLINAFLARTLGNDAKRTGGTKTYAQYAKEMLLESALTIDPVGSELNNSGLALPCREVNYRGYYDVNAVFASLFAYDLLIARYRSDQSANGLTPIEDYFVRDYLAAFVASSLRLSAGMVSPEAYALDHGGMWDTARKIGALCITFGMPAYSTEYYGTCGMNGNTTRYPWTPYPDYPLTWKEVFVDNNAPLRGYPNLSVRLGVEEYNLTDDGQFQDRVQYYGFPLMGHCFAVAANMSKMYNPAGPGFPRFEKSLVRCSTDPGIMGLKDTSGPTRYSALTTFNRGFPLSTKTGLPWMLTLDAKNSESVNKLLPSAGVFAFAWYDDQSYLPSTPTGLRIAR